MMQKSSIQEQIWNYIDGSTTAAEKAYAEKMISTNEEWKTAYREQLELHQLLAKETELEQPSMRFSKNVMDAVSGMMPKPATKTYINKYIIRSIAAFFILTISVILVYALAKVNWTTGTGTANLLPFDFNQMRLPQLNISKYVNTTVINVVFMVALVLGLMFFDGILRRKKSAA